MRNYRKAAYHEADPGKKVNYDYNLERALKSMIDRINNQQNPKYQLTMLQHLIKAYDLLQKFETEQSNRGNAEYYENQLKQYKETEKNLAAEIKKTSLWTRIKRRVFGPRTVNLTF